MSCTLEAPDTSTVEIPMPDVPLSLDISTLVVPVSMNSFVVKVLEDVLEPPDMDVLMSNAGLVFVVVMVSVNVSPLTTGTSWTVTVSLKSGCVFPFNKISTDEPSRLVDECDSRRMLSIFLFPEDTESVVRVPCLFVSVVTVLVSVTVDGEIRSVLFLSIVTSLVAPDISTVLGDFSSVNEPVLSVLVTFTFFVDVSNTLSVV